jgi:uncharacterized membrane-anchored protein YhcB (DUF1043 family)
MQKSEIAKSRERFQKAKNRKQMKNAKKNENVKNKMLNKKKQVFQDFTTRESSQFERVEMKMTAIHDEMMNSKTALAVHRVDSVSERRRNRERKKERKRSRERRDRERKQAIMSKEI